MKSFDVIIVGGGPAGASCAGELARHGWRTAILEKQVFPRAKLCAGWITPAVFRDLACDPSSYPYGIRLFKTIFFHVFGLTVPVKTHQYAIRRIEFDYWLLKRSSARIITHRVRKIENRSGTFVVDGQYAAPYIVGAGGTRCPVARSLFASNHLPAGNRCIVTQEKEFKVDRPHRSCHLWFFRHGLPGYAWLVPKAHGYVNIGIGGKQSRLKQKQAGIRDHWDWFIADLIKSGYINKDNRIRPKGYTYFLRQSAPVSSSGNAFLTGDALGLATTDMGEGIGPAVKSGILAAQAMATGADYRPRTIAGYSLPGLITAGFRRFTPNP